MNAIFDPRDRSAGKPRPWSICPRFVEHADRIVAGLTDHGHVVVDDFVTADFVARLHTEAHALRTTGAFRPAGVGRGASWRRDLAVRGDEVLWVDPGRPTREQAPLLAVMDDLRLVLNRHLYLGLTDYEAHLAVYPAGHAYVRHRDQHSDSDARVVTTSLYLNDDWAPGDGGRLRLFLDDGRTLEVPPVGGVLVVFLSQDLDHEVLPARRERTSWTGWMRRDSRGR